MARFVAAGALLLIPFPAFAASGTASSMLTVLLSLALILGGFVAVAWFARRYLPGMGAQGAVKVVGTTAVGARERVVVVEVDDTWLLPCCCWWDSPRRSGRPSRSCRCWR